MAVDSSNGDWEQELERIPSPTNATSGRTSVSLGEERLYLRRHDYDLVLMHILLAISCIAVFLLPSSYALSKDNPESSDVFLSLGVELLTGAALVFLLYKNLNSTREKWAVRICLSVGVLLSLTPVFWEPNWLVKLTGISALRSSGGLSFSRSWKAWMESYHPKTIRQSDHYQTKKPSHRFTPENLVEGFCLATLAVYETAECHATIWFDIVVSL